MNTPLAYLNGKLVPFAEAALPLHDAGFVSGATIVDNARTFRHKLFRWPDHLARFIRDCAACYVPLEASDEQLTATAEELVAHNAKLLPPDGELQLVTFATPGPLGFYLGESANGPPTLGMVTYPLPFARYRPFFTEGVTLAIAGTQTSEFTNVLPPMVKHRSRMAWHMAEHEVRQSYKKHTKPGAVPVLTNREGVGDTAIGSILVVVDGEVIRPAWGTVLDGVSLGVVAQLCRACDIGFREQQFNMAGLGIEPRPAHGGELSIRVSEVMLAGTGFCLAGVREFVTAPNIKFTRTYPWPGPVFRKLLAAWSDLVGLDIEKQFTQLGAIP